MVGDTYKIIKCVLLFLFINRITNYQIRSDPVLDRSVFDNALSTLRCTSTTNLWQPKPFSVKNLINLEKHEKSIYNFYLGMSACQQGDRSNFIKYINKSLWIESTHSNSIRNGSVFILPEKILNVLESCEAKKTLNTKDADGVVLFVMEAGIGPVKISAGNNKNVGYLEGGPSQVEWVFYTKDSETRIYPSDSVMELARVARLTKKEFHQYYQERRDKSQTFKSVGSSLLLSSTLNQSLSVINKSYTYSGYASDAMLGLGLVSLLASSSSANSSIKKEVQLENLPNFYGLFATNIAAGKSRSK